LPAEVGAADALTSSREGASIGTNLGAFNVERTLSRGSDEAPGVATAHDRRTVAAVSAV